MFRVQETGGGALYNEFFKSDMPANLPASFDRFVIADVWDIDMETALVSMGDRAKLIHGLPLLETALGLGTFISTYRGEHSARIAELIEYSIGSGTPFCYVAELADPRKGPVMGIGGIAGNKLAGVFLALRFPTRNHIGRTR